MSSLDMYFLCFCFFFLRYTQAGPFDVLPRCIPAASPPICLPLPSVVSFICKFFVRFFLLPLPPSVPLLVSLRLNSVSKLGVPLLL